nr:MAG TPA: hypothetical protein [Caudoviricetes sp.]
MRDYNEIKKSIIGDIDWKINYYNSSENWTYSEAFCSLMDFIDGVSRTLVYCGYDSIDFHNEMLNKLEELK